MKITDSLTFFLQFKNFFLYCSIINQKTVNMKNSQSKYRYQFMNGYCAGTMTRHYCKENGEATSGTESGVGWGATIQMARKRAYASKKIVGNVNIEWVLEEIKIWENGILIKEEY